MQSAKIFKNRNYLNHPWAKTVRTVFFYFVLFFVKFLICFNNFTNIYIYKVFSNRNMENELGNAKE